MSVRRKGYPQPSEASRLIILRWQLDHRGPDCSPAGRLDLLYQGTASQHDQFDADLDCTAAACGADSLEGLWRARPPLLQLDAHQPA